MGGINYMFFVAYFKKSSIPATGLTPTISIQDISKSSLEVDGQSMTEVGLGFYKYNFTDYSNEKDYVFQCDGGATLADSERYVLGSSDNNGEILRILDDASDISDGQAILLGLSHENIYIDNTSYDRYGNLSAARIRLYSTRKSVGTGNNVIATYLITSSGSTAAGRFATWKQVRTG